MSRGHSTIGGIDGGCGQDKTKEIVSHQLGVMEMPINRYQCEGVGIAMQRMH